MRALDRTSHAVGLTDTLNATSGDYRSTEMRATRVTPTRHALNETTDRLEVARTGMAVLERRRDGLVLLTLSLLERWRDCESDLEAAFERATRTRDRALELEGLAPLVGAAEARATHPELLVVTHSLEGVPVPLFLSRGVHSRLDERGYGLVGTSAAVDETADAHEAVIEHVVRRAEVELVVRVLLAEIRWATIRVQALRHRVIPDLEETVRYVEAHLAEREREERLVQRFVKRKREAAREARRQSRDNA